MSDKLRNNNYYSVELFSGAGGMCLGFELAGFQTVAANDIDKNSCETFYFNRKSLIDCGKVNFLKEISIIDSDRVNAKTLLKNMYEKKIHVLAGGPPCQGISQSGKRRIDDPRNSLFKHYSRMLFELKPDVFVFENVKGLFNGSRYKDLLTRIKTKLGESGPGYWIDAQLLNADNFGVPQRRERVFIIGVNKLIFSSEVIIKDFFESLSQKGDEIKRQLSGKAGSKTTVADAISDLHNISALLKNENVEYSFKPQSRYQRVMRNMGGKKYSRIVTNHKSMKHSESLKLRFALIEENTGLINLTNLRDSLVKRYENKINTKCSLEEFVKQEISSCYKDVIKFHGINMDKVKFSSIFPGKVFKQRHRKPKINGQCHTITCHVEDEVINPYGVRMVTPREAARLQSFPDWYNFCGPSIVFHGKNVLSQTEQIGNAVPPLLAYAIAKNIKEIFFKDKDGGRIDLKNDWSQFSDK